MYVSNCHHGRVSIHHYFSSVVVVVVVTVYFALSQRMHVCMGHPTFWGHTSSTLSRITCPLFAKPGNLGHLN